MSDGALGDRSSAPREILSRAGRSAVGLESAIDQIANIQLLFVDQARIQQLADLMRARVAARLGLPAPPVPDVPSVLGQPILRPPPQRGSTVAEEGSMYWSILVIAFLCLLAGAIASSFNIGW
jgi:hypothetical protein